MATDNRNSYFPFLLLSTPTLARGRTVFDAALKKELRDTQQKKKGSKKKVEKRATFTCECNLEEKSILGILNVNRLKSTSDLYLLFFGDGQGQNKRNNFFHFKERFFRC